MRFRETNLQGVVVVEQERFVDERGYFARTFDHEVFAQQGIAADVVQMSTSFNARLGTLRGLHYQAAPSEEAKLVRCTRGAVYDVALDLRDRSPTSLQWHGVELSAENGLALFIPRGCAHGFQTLAADTEILYVMADQFVPEAARGLRWDDTAFGIDWPAAPPGGRVISERDAAYPDFRG